MVTGISQHVILPKDGTTHGRDAKCSYLWNITPPFAKRLRSATKANSKHRPPFCWRLMT